MIMLYIILAILDTNHVWYTNYYESNIDDMWHNILHDCGK